MPLDPIVADDYYSMFPCFNKFIITKEDLQLGVGKFTSAEGHKSIIGRSTVGHLLCSKILEVRR